MSSSAASADSQDPSFYRCRVQSDNSRAVLRAGWRKIEATLQETSIDGYTVLVSEQAARKLRVGRPWLLEHEGARIEVHPQWVFNSPDGQVQLGLRRLRDLTPPEPIRKSVLARVGGRRCEDPSVSAAAFGGFVLFLFCLMALPGLGDRLGTADRIQAAFHWVIDGIDESLGGYL